tara:strand:- start:113 stop:562 length:450 start_codon:yes stop_codon:yes gene_type:complete
MHSSKTSTCASYSSYPYKDPKHRLYVDYTTYMEINRVAGDKIVEELAQGKEVVLPSRLGTLRLYKHKQSKKKKHVDFKLTKEYGKTIYHKNLKTNGYYFRLHWAKYGQAANFKNKSVWAFSVTRSQQRYKENSFVKYITKHGLKHLIEK